MNYYPFHIGDYVSATRHLTWEEDAAYRRLLDTYYITEQPLPTDSKAVFRLVLATTKTQQKAVQTVLEEFFVLTENGWCNTRADKEIASMKDRQGESQTKKSNEHERTRRHREQRSMMFSALREKGVKPNWDIKIKELEDLYKLHCEDLKRTCNVTGGVTSNAPATAIPIPTPTPTPTPTPNKGEVLEASRVHAHEAPPARTPKTFPPLDEPEPEKTELPRPSATMYGATCIALKAAGIADVAPGNLEFRALVDSGIGIDVFTQVAIKAVAAGKGRFKYVLAAVNGQVKDAQATAAEAKSATSLRAITGGKAAYQNPLKATDAASETEKARQMLFGGGGVPTSDDPNVVDVDARFVGEAKGVKYA